MKWVSSCLLVTISAFASDPGIMLLKEREGSFAAGDESWKAVLYTDNATEVILTRVIKKKGEDVLDLNPQKLSKIKFLVSQSVPIKKGSFSKPKPIVPGCIFNFFPYKPGKTSSCEFKIKSEKFRFEGKVTRNYVGRDGWGVRFSIIKSKTEKMSVPFDLFSAELLGDVNEDGWPEIRGRISRAKCGVENYLLISSPNSKEYKIGAKGLSGNCS